ncbi:MAG TPA: ATP-binding protein [Blastocatellia bacterium]|nr:ATP-binding protein [Blastocatellia bacterium]
MKANRAVGKAGPRPSQRAAPKIHAPDAKSHPAEPPSPTPVESPGSLELLDNLSLSLAEERASLDALVPFLHERVAFKIPSEIRFIESVLDYLNERMIKLGIVDSQESLVLMALDEAIVNAIKHGNGGDARKAVNIVAELSAREACFTVSDEGPGFARENVPDPTDPSRLLEPNGRGLFLINHIMDEVCYNKCGNEIRMIKRPAPARNSETESMSEK